MEAEVCTVYLLEKFESIIPLFYVMEVIMSFLFSYSS